MKSFADASFFRAFEALLATAKPSLNRTHWDFEGADFVRERHSFTGPGYAFATEVFTISRPGRRGWRLLVVKEYWWAGSDGEPLRTFRWARLVSGRRSDALAWIREQEAALERSNA